MNGHVSALRDQAVANVEFWGDQLTSGRFPDADSLMLLDAGAGRYQEAEVALTLGLLPDGFRGATGMELGCGVGRLTVHFASVVDRLVAYELVPELANLAKARLERLGIRNVTIEVGDVAEAKLPSRSSDLVVAKWIASYVDDAHIDGFLAAIAKAVRPGGTLLFQDTVLVTGANAAEWGSPARVVRLRRAEWYRRHLLRHTDEWVEITDRDLSGVLGAPSPRAYTGQYTLVARRAPASGRLARTCLQPHASD